MIPMPIEHSHYQYNALYDSNVNRTIQSNTLFIYVLKLHNHGVRCYKTLSREQIIQNNV